MSLAEAMQYPFIHGGKNQSSSENSSMSLLSGEPTLVSGDMPLDVVRTTSKSSLDRPDFAQMPSMI